MAEPTKICARCGLQRPKLEFCGRAWCDTCERAYADEMRVLESRVANKNRYDRRKALGLCQSCDSPARPGRVRCERCAGMYNERRRAQAKRRREP
jgi:hypothetical protein